MAGQERISAAEYRRLVGIAPPPPRTFAPADYRALGRLPAGTMNKSEARYAATLEADPDVLWWKFEAIRLVLAPRTTLTVDFFVLRAGGALECVDVKGSKAIYQEDARAKTKIAASIFPFVFKIAIPRPLKAGGGWTIEEVGR